MIPQAPPVNDSQVYEPVKEMIPQAPPVNTFLDSRVSTAQNDSKLYEPVKEMTPHAPTVYTFIDSSTQQLCSKCTYITL